MFSFKKSGISPELSQFAASFSAAQKGAIMAFTFMVATADSQIHPKEEISIKQLMLLLEIDPNNPSNSTIRSNTVEEMIKQLKTLDSSQLDWLIVSIHGLMCADGEINDSELNTVSSVFDSLGITQEKYVEVIEKTMALMNYFNK